MLVNKYFLPSTDQILDSLEIDNLVYKRSMTQLANGFQASKDACQAFPGFRLVVVRFQEQMDIMLRKCKEHSVSGQNCVSSNWFYVDMIFNGEDIVVGGDTPLAETDLAATSVTANDGMTYFIYAHTSQLHDENDSWNTNPLCQANVFGVNW